MRTLRLLVKKICPKKLWDERVSILVDRWEATPPPSSRVELDILERFVIEEGLLAVAQSIMQKHDFTPHELDPWATKRQLEQFTALALSPDDKRLLDYTAADPDELFLHGEAGGRFPIGVQKLDEALDGGIGPGELGVFIAPYGGGKTAALIGQAVQGALAGKRVLHITLEIRTRKVAERATMEILGKTKEEIRADPKLIRRALNRVKRAGGQLLIQDLSHEKVSMQRVEGLIARYSPLDIVAVDYADLLGRSRRKWQSDPRMVVGDIYWELRRQGSAYDTRVWTASQTHRAAIGAEEFGGEAVAEDISKMHTVDIAICIMQTKEEKERGIQRWKLDKGREEPDNPTVTIRYDYKRMTRTEVTKAGGTDGTTKAKQGRAGKGRKLDSTGKGRARSSRR